MEMRVETECIVQDGDVIALFNMLVKCNRFQTAFPSPRSTENLAPPYYSALSTV